MRRRLAVGLVLGLLASTPAGASAALAAPMPLTGVSASLAIPALSPRVPGCVGSSLCEGSNLPMLFEEFGSGAATTNVPVAAAQRGGYVAARKGGGYLRDGEVYGGVAGTIMSALGWAGAHFGLGDESQGGGNLPAKVYSGAGAVSGSFNVDWKNSGGTVLKTNQVGFSVTVAGITDGARGTGTLHIDQLQPFSDATYVVGSTHVDTYVQCQSQVAANSWTLAWQYSGSKTGPIDNSFSITCSSGIARVKVVYGPTPGVAYIGLGSASVDWDPTPRRFIQQTGHCEFPSGRVEDVVTTGPMSTDAQGYDAPGGSCPDGSVLTGVGTRLMTDTAISTDVGLQKLPRRYLHAALGSDPDHPCYLRPGQGACKLTIHRKTGGTSPVPDDWAGTDPGLYECRYGGAPIAIEFCWPYAPFTPTDPVPVPVEDPDTPGQPIKDPVLDPHPSPSPSTTGNPTPSPSPSTSVEPSPTPSTSGQPTPSPSTSGPVGAEPDPRSLGEENVGCVHWTLGNFLTGKVVYQAVGCALEWAFVPSTAAVNGFVTAVRDAWQESGPGVTIESASGALGSVVSGSGGGGGGACPSFAFPVRQGQRVDFCAYGVGGVAGTVRGLSAVLFGVLALLASVSLVLGAFGVRTPFRGGGGDE